MNKKRLSRKLTLALCIVFSMTLFAGCTSKTPVKEETKKKRQKQLRSNPLSTILELNQTL